MPVRNVCINNRIGSGKVPNVPAKKVAVNPVTLRLTERYQVALYQLQVRSKVEWHLMMGNQLSASTADSTRLTSEEVVTHTTPLRGPSCSWRCLAA